MSIIPVKHNFVLWRNGTFRKVLTLHTGATTTSPVRNFTGYTAKMSIVDTSGSTLKTLTTTNGGIVLGGTAGTITLFISDEDTSTFTWSNALYELSITNSAGDTDVILFGGITVRGLGV